jgi:uncharacterized membrane protein YcaP (DUF421 family)
MPLGVGELVARAAIVYLVVLLILRLAGKRHFSLMSPTEFVAILLVSNAVQNAMNGGDNSVQGGIVLALTIVILSWLISWTTYRFRAARTLFEGTPTLLVHRGRAVTANLRAEHLSETELHALLREQGIHRLGDLESAVLEADGHLSVICTKDVRGRRSR